MPGSLGRPWFAHKRFGYGAALPVTWQGWVAVLLFFVGIFSEMALTSNWLRAIVFTLIVCAFVAVCALKTEGGLRWRWGGDDD